MKLEWFMNSSRNVGKWNADIFLRANNKIVDCIAKEAGDKTNQLIVLEDPPQNVRHILEEDIQYALYSEA